MPKEYHKDLVGLAIKVKDQCEELLQDREINEELKKAKKELADVRKRVDTFFEKFRLIADELEYEIGRWIPPESP